MRESGKDESELGETWRSVFGTWGNIHSNQKKQY